MAKKGKERGVQNLKISTTKGAFLVKKTTLFKSLILMTKNTNSGHKL